MLTFREAALEDIDDVFFNAEEFMEKHVVDGKECDVIPDEVMLQEHAAHWEGGSKQSFDVGLYESVKRIYIRIADYGKPPKIGRRMEYDDILFEIVNCAEEMGLYIVDLKRVRQ